MGDPCMPYLTGEEKGPRLVRYSFMVTVLLQRPSQAPWDSPARPRKAKLAAKPTLEPCLAANHATLSVAMSCQLLRMGREMTAHALKGQLESSLHTPRCQHKHDNKGWEMLQTPSPNQDLIAALLPSHLGSTVLTHSYTGAHGLTLLNHGHRSSSLAH